MHFQIFIDNDFDTTFHHHLFHSFLNHTVPKTWLDIIVPKRDYMDAPENAIDRIDDRHEFRLPVVLRERYFAKEVRLHEVERRDPAQDNTGLVIVEIFAIDGA